MIGMILLVISTIMAFSIMVLPGMSRMQTITGVKIVESFTAISAFLISSAFFYLIYAFMQSDLSFLNVALNSHSASEIFYKICGVWGNHEGSMLLWLVLLTIVSTVYVLQRHLPWQTRLGVVRILGSISFCFHLFILLISNPFVQLHQVPIQGMGLNPLLEDPALAIHPPILFTGLALLSVLYASSCERFQRIDRNWAQSIRPWAMACWIFLTLGIALGSWWAYYELGWGGWWFWDPVENLSLLPWLIVTALLHSLIAVEKDAGLRLAAPLLGMLAFLLSLFSLFLVRSGMLTSVHAFALDPYRGGFLGAIFMIYLLYAFRIWMYRARSLTHQPYFLSREAFLFFNLLLLTAIMAMVLVGTVYPILLQQATDHIISVGAPYFNAATFPFLFLMIVLMVATPFVGWHQHSLRKKISYVATSGLFLFVLVSYWKQGWPVIASLFIAAAACLLISTIIDFYERRRQLSLRFLSMGLAHASVAFFIIAAVIDTFEKTETIQAMHQDASIDFQGFNITLIGVQQLRAPYFERETANFSVALQGTTFHLTPEKRYYPLHEMITSETAIHRIGLGDIYAVFGGRGQGDDWIVKLSWHPVIHLLWCAVGLMILAGLLGLRYSLRKLRTMKFIIPLALTFITQAHADDFKDLTTSIYCPSCQGQVLDESSSSLAVEMKQEIYRRLKEGESVNQIREHFVQLHGEKILLKPQWQPYTILLWFAPYLVFALLFLIVLRRMIFFPQQNSVKLKK